MGGLTCKSERRACPVSFRREKRPGVRKKEERTGTLWAHEIDKDFRVTECSPTYPIQKRWSVIARKSDTPRAIVPGVRHDMVTRGEGEREKREFRYAPPSQAAILDLDRRIGSFAIKSIALRGWGWRCMAVCSKRGPVAGVGLGPWFSDHSPGWFGA